MSTRISKQKWSPPCADGKDEEGFLPHLPPTQWKDFCITGLRGWCSLLSLPGSTLGREGGTQISALSQDAHCLQESSEFSDLTLLQVIGFTLNIFLSSFKNLLISSVEQQNVTIQVGGCTTAIPLCRGKTVVSLQVPEVSLKEANNLTICISLL